VNSQRFKLDHDYAGIYGLDGDEIKDRLVLDIGADKGSTAEFFLNLGARAVVCSEPVDGSYFRQLEAYAFNKPEVAVVGGVHSYSDAHGLLKAWKPEVVKLDCEGAEKWFLRGRLLMRGPRVWLVEAHSQNLYEEYKRVLGRWYSITDVCSNGNCHTIKAVNFNMSIIKP
jgi:hypothetical protein